MRLGFVVQSMLYRKGNILGALVAQALAVAIIFANMLVLLSTFNGPGVAPRLEAADLVVRVNPAKKLGVAADSVPFGMQFRLPPDLAGQIATIEGVQAVIPDTTFFAQIVDAEGHAVIVSDDATPRGQAWEAAALTPFELQEGRAPAAPGEIAIDRALAQAGGLAVGDETLVVSNAGPEHVRITGIVGLAEADGMEGQASVFFPSEVAASLSRGADGPQLLGVMLEPGAASDLVRHQIQHMADDDAIETLTGGARGKADVTAGAEQLLELGIVLGVMAGFVGFVAIFVLAGTFSFSIQQRYREIGLQRAVGFTPGQVRRLIVVEATVIALLGSVAGVVAGWLLAYAFVWVAIRQGRAPEGFTVAFHSLAMWIVLGTSFGIALVAALSASRRATKIRPIEALRDASAPKRWIGFRRLLLGLLFVIGGGVAVGVSTAAPAVIAVLMSLLITTTLTIGLALLGPLLVAPFVALMRPFMRTRTDATGDLATSNTRNFPARVASVASPVLLSLGFATLMFGFVATSRVAAVQISGERMVADLYVVPGSVGLPRSIVPLIGGLDGVQAVDAQVAADMTLIGDDSDYDMPTVGVDPDSVGETMALTFQSGGLDEFGPGTVLLSDFVTLDLPVGTGDTAIFRMEDLTLVELRIVGVFTNSLGTADALVTQADLVPRLYDPLLALILVNVAEGADTQAVTEAIERLAAEGYPLQVLTHEQYVAGVDQSVESGSWATFLIIGAAALFGALSVVNTLTMSTIERAREFALLRLIGATPRQVQVMLAKEAAIVSLMGVSLGWGIGLLSTLAVSFGYTGDASAMMVPLLPVLGVGLLAVAIVFSATLIPGLIALRRVPMEEIGVRV